MLQFFQRFCLCCFILHRNYIIIKRHNYPCYESNYKNGKHRQNSSYNSSRNCHGNNIAKANSSKNRKTIPYSFFLKIQDILRQKERGVAFLRHLIFYSIFHSIVTGIKSRFACTVTNNNAFINKLFQGIFYRGFSDRRNKLHYLTLCELADFLSNSSAD